MPRYKRQRGTRLGILLYRSKSTIKVTTADIHCLKNIEYWGYSFSENGGSLLIVIFTIKGENTIKYEIKYEYIVF